VAQGLPVKVTMDGLPGREFAGTVAAVSPLGDSVGRLFDARISLPSVPGLRAGMFARGKIALQTVEATVAPVSAVVTQGSEKFVFVVEGDVARRLPVTTGIQRDGIVQVIGVPAGSRIVTQGQQSLLDGSKIRIDAANEGSGS
jgi:multidrug efflux pump subunit AcrA (membrane-fusion protein)